LFRPSVSAARRRDSKTRRRRACTRFTDVEYRTCRRGPMRPRKVFVPWRTALVLGAWGAQFTAAIGAPFFRLQRRLYALGADHRIRRERPGTYQGCVVAGAGGDDAEMLGREGERPGVSAARRRDSRLCPLAWCQFLRGSRRRRR